MPPNIKEILARKKGGRTNLDIQIKDNKRNTQRLLDGTCMKQANNQNFTVPMLLLCT